MKLFTLSNFSNHKYISVKYLFFSVRSKLELDIAQVQNGYLFAEDSCLLEFYSAV